MVAQQNNYNFSMIVPNPYWFRNLTYFSQIPTLLGLMGLHNSLGPLLSSGLRPDFLHWERWYPLDYGRISSTGNAYTLYTGIPCYSIYHCSAHQITSALDAANELVHRSELVRFCFANELVHVCF